MNVTREHWVGTDAVAEYIDKPVSWVLNNAARTGLPRRKIGLHYRYKLSQVDAWLEALEVA